MTRDVRAFPGDKRKHTLVEVEQLAQSEELERILLEVGAPLSRSTGKLRKWSELRGFDRSSFDFGSYLRSLKG